MRKKILYMISLISFCILNAQTPGIVKLYLEDGSTKQINYEDIDNMKFTKSFNYNLMRIYCKGNNNLIEYIVSEIDSIQFENNMMIISFQGKIYNQNPWEIDSIIFLSANNNIETVTIGTQTWMIKNLDVDHYKNGDLIPEVKDSIEWINLTTGAWCYFNNDPSNGAVYGKLYNWYAVNDSRGLAPEGWHIPSDAEWKTLEMYLGMSQSEADLADYRGTDEGAALKEAGLTHWWWDKPPYNTGTNSSGFTAYGGGYRLYINVTGYPSFNNLTASGQWWTSTAQDAATAWLRHLCVYHSDVARMKWGKTNGCSVRCIKE
jgi:uncharacterized protein (TIGR02145 family)